MRKIKENLEKCKCCNDYKENCVPKRLTKNLIMLCPKCIEELKWTQACMSKR